MLALFVEKLPAGSPAADPGQRAWNLWVSHGAAMGVAEPLPEAFGWDLDPWYTNRKDRMQV